MFTPRTTPVKEGEKPFAWDVPSVYQCTWFAYYESLFHNLSAPCWFDGSGSEGYGSYTNAKEWLKHYRDPWEVKGVGYTPVQGDIAVFDGQYGHVQFMETDTMYAEYRSGNKDSFANGIFTKSSNLLGFLHYPLSTVDPVERNTNVNQIQVTDDTLRIRTKPSLNAEIVGHAQLGYYNVLSEKNADGFTWYQLAKDRWCANVSVIYLPAQDDVLKELERIFTTMRTTIEEKDKQLAKTNEKIRKIKEICDE